MWKEIETPCNGSCEIDEQTHLCKHCLRTIDEIESWPYFNNNDKREVYKLIQKRRTILDSVPELKRQDLKWVS